jgi:hypothetical protein
VRGGDVRERTEAASVVHPISHDKLADASKGGEIRPEQRRFPHLVHNDSGSHSARARREDKFLRALQGVAMIKNTIDEEHMLSGD